jgi:ribosome-associated protein
MKEKMEINITGKYIELFKLLKWAGLVNDGAQAKMFIDDGEVLYNGEVELKKRKKVYPGDVVIFQNTLLHILKEEE